MAKVKNIINNNGNPAVNQFVITAGDKVFFQSYDSVIAMWSKSQRKLYITNKWDYSATTRKHFYIFLNAFTAVRGTRETVLQGLRDGTIGMVSEECLSY